MSTPPRPTFADTIGTLRSSLCASLESVRLGHWHTPERADAFAASGVSVLDPPEPS